MNLFECPFCKNKIEIKNKYYKYKTCGSKECLKHCTQKTNIDRYGHSCTLHNEDIRKEIKKKLKKKYGEDIENISQVQSIKKKKKETCFKNFGVEHPMQSKIIREKSVVSCLKKYNVDNVSKNKDIIEKILKSKNQLTEEGITVNKSALIKRINLNLKKYNKEHYFETEEFKNKYIKTMLEKYGVSNIRKSEYYHNLMVLKGFRYAEKDLTEKKKYYNNVLKYTRKSVNIFKNVLFNKIDEDIEYQIDHIYSISSGFKNDINPNIIGSIINLQLLPANINLEKSDDCWITKEELINNYEKYSFAINNN